jgi:hypothetical protein
MTAPLMLRFRFSRRMARRCREHAGRAAGLANPGFHIAAERVTAATTAAAGAPLRQDHEVG